MASIVVIFASVVGFGVAAIVLVAGHGWLTALVALYAVAIGLCLAIFLFHKLKGRVGLQRQKKIQTE
ncbi:hypothetical protein [Roseobacter weihaiensis]|uniref:hypothetical protein n=1 Tax=Roseobacter weihaiensis TaxID=2763262 RepID=UPI001D0A13C4|nr:hypothetical protein [Roseobacter sp. H9]